MHLHPQGCWETEDTPCSFNAHHTDRFTVLVQEGPRFTPPVGGGEGCDEVGREMGEGLRWMGHNSGFAFF